MSIRKVFGSSESVTQASFILISITVISKIIAYIESATVAAFFGTSTEIDLFYLANSISAKFIFTVFAGLSVVIITMYNNAVKVGGKEKGNRFISSILAVVIPIALCTTLFLYAIAPVISAFMANTYSSDEQEMLCYFIRVLSFVSVFYAICIVLTAVLNANRRFVPGALCVSLQNITLILSVVVLFKRIHVWALIIGFLFGYIFQGIFLYICVKKIITLSRFSLKDDLDIRKLLLLLLPLILGEASSEVNVLVDQFISTGLGVGYVSALSYAGSLDEFVSSFFVQTISTVLLPFFSVLVVEKKFDEMATKMKTVINTVIIVLLPITLVTVFVAKDIVSVVYERGYFDTDSVVMTSAALTGYGIGFIFKAIFVMSRRPFFAMENTKIPMCLGIFSVAINITLTILLGHIWGIFGVTIATTIAFMLGDILSISIMNKMFSKKVWKRESVFLGKLIFAGVVSGACVYLISNISILNKIARFGLCTIGCFIVYAICLYVLKVEEFSLGMYSIMTKIRNKKKG